MMVFIDTVLPWLGDLLAMGGNILALILFMAMLIWSLLCERVYYLFILYPEQLKRAVRLWEARDDKISWYAVQYREHLRHRINADLNRSFGLISTIIKICPLLGLLGTVAEGNSLDISGHGGSNLWTTGVQVHRKPRFG